MELEGRDFAYDGEKIFFIIAALPGNKLDFTIVLENISSNRSTGNSISLADESPDENDRKRLKRPYQSKTYKVEISYAGKSPVQAIAQALRGQDSENSQEALRVLDIILRQHAAKRYVIVYDLV
ncbi:protein argonaute 4-like [Apium graveolens]|uniref:protein argonaute 4-like n=1 Tax=Apium graveolens TaxID=4045 RepID=UPI003D794687